jgi:hypothetical protein
MHRGNIAAAGIFLLSAVGLSACDGGGPETTGSTNPPAAESGSEAPAQALPTTEGQDGTQPAEGGNSGG